jgi:hypothetical protein
MAAAGAVSGLVAGRRHALARLASRFKRSHKSLIATSPGGNLE